MEEYVIALIDDGIMAGDGLEFNIAITEQGEAVPFPVLGAEGQRPYNLIAYQAWGTFSRPAQ